MHIHPNSPIRVPLPKIITNFVPETKSCSCAFCLSFCNYHSRTFTQGTPGHDLTISIEFLQHLQHVLAFHRQIEPIVIEK